MTSGTCRPPADIGIPRGRNTMHGHLPTWSRYAKEGANTTTPAGTTEQMLTTRRPTCVRHANAHAWSGMAPAHCGEARPGKYDSWLVPFASIQGTANPRMHNSDVRAALFH